MKIPISECGLGLHFVDLDVPFATYPILFQQMLRWPMSLGRWEINKT